MIQVRNRRQTVAGVSGFSNFTAAFLAEIERKRVEHSVDFRRIVWEMPRFPANGMCCTAISPNYQFPHRLAGCPDAPS